MTNETTVCEYCLGEGIVIRDYSDHNGEHVQYEMMCECQLENNEE